MAEHNKVGKVIGEFNRGALRSSGQKVTNPKQAVAIGLSEASKKKNNPGPKRGGGQFAGSKSPQFRGTIESPVV